MSKQFWADSCSAALEQLPASSFRNLIYSTHAFTCGCFVAASAFSGLWLCRWLRIKRLQPQLLRSVWRFVGRFLALTFSCCIFGTVGWINKILGVFGSRGSVSASLYSSEYQLWSCQEFYGFVKELNQLQSSYGICHSFESLCLFLSILLGLDRIIEHAYSAGNTVISNAVDSPYRSSAKNVFSQNQPSLRGKPNTEQLLSTNRSSKSAHVRSGASSLELAFKCAIVIIACSFVVSLFFGILAAAIQAKSATDLRVAIDLCHSNGSFTTASENIYDGVVETTFDTKMRSIFAGHVAQCAGASMVIVLYAAAGSLGYSIVRSARKKIETSRVRLQQLRANMDTRQDSTAAADAGAVRSILFVYTRM
jgi:hypothetical protein